MMTVKGPYERPTRSRALHPFVQRDFPEIRRDKLEGKILSRNEFALAAARRPSPLAALDKAAAASLDQDLKAAIDHHVAEHDAVPEQREERLRALRKVADSLGPLRATLDACKCETARLIAADFNAAWVAALIDAMQWPDVRMPLLYIIGFPVVFDIPDSGVFRAEYQPAEIPPEEFMRANTRVVTAITDEIERSAKQGDAEQRERRQQCWQRTEEEIAEGLVQGPFSRARMDKKYGRGRSWRCLGRSAIKQKNKWRCIDNGKRAKHNRATTLHERITCGRADFPIMIAREFARRLGGIRKRRRLRMSHGTEDLRAAYRHVPTSQPQFTCVAVWNPNAKKVQYCEVPGHNFGLKSAVVNFNRCPELTTAAARRLLWVVSEHYYDDNDVCEPTSARLSGQECLVELNSVRFAGFPYDPAKRLGMAPTNEYLGVESSFARITESVLTMHVSKKRRAKLRELVNEVWHANELRSGLASSIFGKAGFMMSPCYSSLGRACLHPIKTREYQPRLTEITTDIAESLEFIQFVCDHLPALELPLEPPTDTRPVIIFTDAEGKKRNRSGTRPPSGHVGFVVYHPIHGTVHAHAKVPDELVKLFDDCKQRDTYIGQFELIAAITPFISLPREWLVGRPVELWIDNSGAIGALLNGYSGVPDCARIVNMFHFAVAKAGCASLWIDYVPSESNPADVPSRFHEMTLAERQAESTFLGTEVRMHLPAFADASGAWLSPTAIAASVW